MFLNRLFHKMEKKAYQTFSWISHTNEDRMRLFLKDLGIQLSNTHILPNYPPKAWSGNWLGPTQKTPIRFIYVGALSMDTMFTKEFADWIISQNGIATWDIVSDNITREARSYLQSLKSDLIKFMDGVNYRSLPHMLRAFHVGIILYKGHIPNYIYNIPNKLFEYEINGIDTWFPIGMESCLVLATKGTFPQIKAIDFENLPGPGWTDSLDRKMLTPSKLNKFCEDEFEFLLHTILEQNKI